MAPTIASQLAPLIGLDEQTTREQVVPHLESIKDERLARDYLVSLLAPGDASRKFIDAYLLRVRGGSTTRRPSPPPPRIPTLSSSSSSHTTTTKNSRPQHRPGGNDHSTPPVPVPVAEMSPDAKDELARIERALEGFGRGRRRRRQQSRRPPTAFPSAAGGGGGRDPLVGTKACFCSARQHAVSTYAPVCPACGLVLCVVNRVVDPCPSCTHAPLVAPSDVDRHVAELEHRRDRVVERETTRARERAHALELERRRIKFPDLAAANDASLGGHGGGVGLLRGGGYAGHAGGGGRGGGLEERIARAYETGVSLNGRNFGAERVAAATQAGSGGGKVLRLDGKGKVKVETKRKKNPPPTAKAKASTVNRTDDDSSSGGEDEDDGIVPWIDPNDDGIRGRRSLESGLTRKNGTTTPPRTTTRTRTFENVTIALDARPVWVEREELGHSIVDETDDAGLNGVASSVA
ncbi:hypothetical protein JCM11491_001111 [Sporobolomyces phaffii]